ncbi:MAG TPA: excinuclease, partial [Candidatus Methanoperedenaceae archaeon]|nr:excinuclease [Candidatus Methanoperedenaceae archaeon]
SYSEELADAIQEKLAEYATLSQSLDRTFPTRLVKGNGYSELTIDALRDDLSKLEKKRSRLMEAGLLDKEKEIDFTGLIQQIGESNRNVLSVYVGDVKEKLKVFDELTDKIDLLVDIINRRFLYKKMSINKKEGFIFETSDGKKISPADLSSGEQHELVLNYELLFKVKPNSLILIDEPELSLHVIWQQQFLKDLQEIIRLAGFDVLLATHAPDIIHDRWDLTVELGGSTK